MLHYSRGGSPEFEYAFQAPSQGKYALVARVATPSWKQGFSVTVNGDGEVQMPLPHTVGLWGMSEPVAIELKNGRNVLRFKRQSGSNEKGISIKEFKLIPWERRLSVLEKDEADRKAQEEASAEVKDEGISPAYRRALGLSLLQDLASISSSGKLEPLPMDLSITSSKVQLLEAKGNGILAFKSLESGKIVAVALDDLALEDHALLGRLVARLLPESSKANARAAAYMEVLGNISLAEAYRKKAGPEAVEQFVVSHQDAE